MHMRATLKRNEGWVKASAHTVSETGADERGNSARASVCVRVSLRDVASHLIIAAKLHGSNHSGALDCRRHTLHTQTELELRRPLGARDRETTKDARSSSQRRVKGINTPSKSGTNTPMRVDTHAHAVTRCGANKTGNTHCTHTTHPHTNISVQQQLHKDAQKHKQFSRSS